MAFSWDKFDEDELKEGTLSPEQANRYNEGKLQWDLMHLSSFEPMIRVLEFGAKKYEKDQWKKGFPIRQIYNSLIRHMIAFMNGEDNDPESGLPHIGHIQCNIMFMAYVLENHPHFDDRSKESLRKNNSEISFNKSDEKTISEKDIRSIKGSLLAIKGGLLDSLDSNDRA